MFNLLEPFFVDKEKSEQEEIKSEVLFCPLADLSKLNQLDPNTIIRKLASWANSKTMGIIDSLERIRLQAFLAGVPQIECFNDILEYATMCHFKDITGFIEYLSIPCN